MTPNKQGGFLCSAHPDVKGSCEVVQVGLDETDVLQAQLGAAALSPEQRLFLVLDEDDLKTRKRCLLNIAVYVRRKYPDVPGNKCARQSDHMCRI